MLDSDKMLQITDGTNIGDAYGFVRCHPLVSRILSLNLRHNLQNDGPMRLVESFSSNDIHISYRVQLLHFWRSYLTP